MASVLKELAYIRESDPPPVFNNLIETLPPRLIETTMNELVNDSLLGYEAQMMLERRNEFRSPFAARVAGIAANPMALDLLNTAIDSTFTRTRLRRTTQEVVIGAGLHAAIYCAVRVSQGFPRPLVLEMNPARKVGGSFAVSRAASFFLNSRNRPGNLGIPGRNAALNVLPMSPIQPADLSADEYQRNSDLALCIRMSLAMYADVVPNRQVSAIRYGSREGSLKYVLDLTGRSRTRIEADNIIIASGLGRDRQLGDPSSRRIMTFSQFMASMDTPFPLRGMKRIAVIGGGDGARTVIEALFGQGPSRQMSSASLDYVESVDWYGPTETTKSAWIACNRTRYRNIAGLLAVGDALAEPARLRIFPGQQFQISSGFNSAYVRSIPYDCVITAIGYETEFDVFPYLRSNSFTNVEREGRFIARTIEDEKITFIGPLSNLPVIDSEFIAMNPGSNAIAENKVAIFRYAERTALIAQNL